MGATFLKGLLTNSFILAIATLIVFRLCLYFVHWEEDGNFLVLVVFPLLLFWGIIQTSKSIYKRKKIS